jgi:drug/metabolite transporter (DMT)-like permease
VLGLFPTALAMLVYFALLRRTGATFVALNNYLIPTLGVLWGVIFLGEHLTIRAAMALGLILLGIVITRVGMRRN